MNHASPYVQNTTRPFGTSPLHGSSKTPPFHEGSIHGVVFQPLKRHGDTRGWLIELFREDEIEVEHLPRMAYASQTFPGASRGPHAHRTQTDFFMFFGPGDFMLYLWDNRPDSPTFGSKRVALVGESSPRSVVIPPGVVHGYKNISEVPGLVFNAPDQLYAGSGRSEPVDEIRYEDFPNNLYMMD